MNTDGFNPIAMKVFEYLVNFKRSHDGNSPTIREITNGCQISSTSETTRFLKMLDHYSLIHRCGRNIEILNGHWDYFGNPPVPLVTGAVLDARLAMVIYPEDRVFAQGGIFGRGD